MQYAAKSGNLFHLSFMTILTAFNHLLSVIFELIVLFHLLITGISDASRYAESHPYWSNHQNLYMIGYPTVIKGVQISGGCACRKWGIGTLRVKV